MHTDKRCWSTVSGQFDTSPPPPQLGEVQIRQEDLACCSLYSVHTRTVVYVLGHWTVRSGAERNRRWGGSGCGGKEIERIRLAFYIFTSCFLVGIENPRGRGRLTWNSCQEYLSRSKSSTDVFLSLYAQLSKSCFACIYLTHPLLLVTKLFVLREKD